MSSSKLLFGLLALIAPVMAFAAEGSAPQDGWLIGTWVLCDDPDGSPKDSLKFQSDGTGLVMRAKGNVEFLHKHSGQSVSLLANANGRAIPIELSASVTFDRLLLRSTRTGNTASYVKLDGPLIETCSIK